jgi:hypothetical protein
MIMKLFDSHAHYFDKKYDAVGSADSVLQNDVFSADVERVINVGTNNENSLICIEQAARYDGMYAAVGIHPEDIAYCGDISDEIGRLADIIGDAQNRMRTNNEPLDNEIAAKGSSVAPVYVQESLAPSGKRVFGRDIFNNKSLTFEPQMNIATPQNYVLGPGDVLVVDVYGASRESLQLKVSPEGDVYVPEFGPIQVSGLQISAAKNRIRARLGKYFHWCCKQFCIPC